jgi:hypothetical protein
MHKNFDEEQLEALLKRLPKVKDNSDPDEMFESIASRMSLESEEHHHSDIEEPSTQVRRKRSFVLPTFAAAAVVILIALMAPSFLYNQDHSSSNNSSSGSSSSESSSSSMDKGESTELSRDDSGRIVEEEQFSIAESSDHAKNQAFIENHVVREVPEQTELIVTAIPDENAQVVVPISFLASKSENRLERLNAIEDMLDEEQWGLSTYFLEDVSFKEDEKEPSTVIINVPKGYLNQGSALDVLFIGGLQQMFSPMGYEQMKFMTDGNPGIEAGNYGRMTNLAVEGEQQGYFVYQKGEQYPKFLTPVSTEGASIEEIIEQMEQGRKDLGLLPSILEAQIKNIKENNRVLTISFNGETDMEQNEQNVLMIEAILLTAKSFGYSQVEFQGTGTEQIGTYNLTQPIDVPISVNPMPYIEKPKG